MKRPPIKRIGISFIAMMAVTMAGCSIGGSDKASGGPDMVKKVRKRGTLRVAVLPDFPPTSVKKSNGDLVGYDPDVAKLLAKALGVKLKLKAIDGDARYSSLKSKRVDVSISAYTATNERARKVAFSIPYKSQGAGVLYQKKKPVKSLKDLAGKKVAVARGSTNDNIITHDYPKATPERFDSIADTLQALKSGKVDAAMETYYVTHKDASKSKQLEALDVPPIKPDLISMGVMPSQQRWLNYLNNFIRNLISQGKLNKLHKQWFGGEKLSSLVSNYG